MFMRKKLPVTILTAALSASMLAGCTPKPAETPNDTSIPVQESEVVIEDSRTDTSEPEISSHEADDKIDVLSLKTVQDVLDLEKTGKLEYITDGAYSTYYINAFTLDGITYRVIADMRGEANDAYWEVDFSDENYQEKNDAIVAPLQITRYEDITGITPSEEELQSFVGKTGAEVIELGWTPWSYNQENFNVSMDVTAFTYNVVFEGTPAGTTDNMEIEDVIAPMTIKSVELLGIGDLIDLEYSGVFLGGEELNLNSEYDSSFIGTPIWFSPEDAELGEEDTAAFNLAVGTTDGAISYESVANLGYREENGMHRCFLAKATIPDNEEALPYYVVLFATIDENGLPSVDGIYPVNLGALYGNDGTYTVKQMIIPEAIGSGIVGRWSVYDDDEDEYDAADVFEALNMDGMELSKCLATQVVAGTNYCFLAHDEVGTEYFVYAYENLDGDVELVNYEIIDVSEFHE